MALLRSFEEMIRMLEAKGVPHRAAPAHRLVELPSAGPLPGPLRMKWEANVPFISLGQLLITSLPEERLRELESRWCGRTTASRCPGSASITASAASTTASRRPCSRHRRRHPGEARARVIGSAKEYLASFEAVLKGRPGADILAIHEEMSAPGYTTSYRD